jgi:transcriptional regulator of acetoin/glycerol metabolism
VSDRSLDAFAISQRDIERQWERALSHEAPSAAVVRDDVRGSWDRSLAAHIDPRLPRAPVALDGDAIERARRDRPWFAVAEALAPRQPPAPSGGNHVLTIFDSDGVMLSCRGDARVASAMAEFNFAPGGWWAERIVGTNGPGTALALGHAVHILGSEHFCRAWHPWQCAATPLYDPLTGRLLGAIDLSGPSRDAHPHTLELVRALGLAVERTLLAEGLARRIALMQAFHDLRARRPGDELAVVDRSGLVVCASVCAPPELREGAVLELFSGGQAMAMDSMDERERQRLGVRAVAPLSGAGAPLGWALTLGARPSLHRPARAQAQARGLGTRYTFADLVGESAGLTQARQVAETAARNDLPVLLIGESGVGKEILAQAIHAASARRQRPFVAVNCAALPPELLESELFGYAPGAFTGAARSGSVGRFEAADGGTLFLDEIGELSAAAQAALLRALQEGEISRLGAVAPRRVDVRVIAATQRNPDVAVRDGVLRRDLYYRLAVLPCEVPPLRTRREDIPLLVERFLERAALELGVTRPRVEAGVWARLEAHEWPGNVRELENLVRRLVATTRGVVRVEDLPAELGAVRAAAGVMGDEDAERERLHAALRSARTLGEAARALGIGRSTLYRWMARYGLMPQRTFGGARRRS